MHGLDRQDAFGAVISAPSAAWRLVRRLRQGLPPEYPHHAALERAFARAAQWFLLIASAAVPATGILDAWVLGDPMTLFGITLWPGVAAARTGAELGFLLHGGPLIMLVITPIILLHLAGTLKHHWIDRDETLRFALTAGLRLQRVMDPEA